MPLEAPETGGPAPGYSRGPWSLGEDTDKERVAAPVTGAAMEVDEDNLRWLGGPVNQANEMGQASPLRKLDGEVVHSVTGGQESPVGNTRRAQDPAEDRQVSRSGLNKDPTGTAGNPDRENGFLKNMDHLCTR